MTAVAIIFFNHLRLSKRCQENLAVGAIRELPLHLWYKPKQKLFHCHPERVEVKRRISFSEFILRSIPTTRFFAHVGAQNDIMRS
jgi:hypothetical protein